MMKMTMKRTTKTRMKRRMSREIISKQKVSNMKTGLVCPRGFDTVATCFACLSLNAARRFLCN